MKKVWIRLGGVIAADEKTMEAILNGDSNAVIKAIEKNGFELNGETYIPAQGDIERDVDFDFMPIKVMHI